MDRAVPLRMVHAALAVVSVLALALATRADATVLVPQADEPKQIAANVYSDGTGPEVAFDGTRFFVVWSSGSAVYGAFLSTDGDVIDPPGVITIESTEGWRPSVSYDGANYLVAWRGPVGDGQVLAKRVSAAGTILDATPIVVASDVKQRRISVAFDGTRHLAVWRTENDKIQGARISTAGVPLDGASGFEIGTGFYPWVESAAGKFLVAWHGHGASELDVYGSLVTHGTPGATFEIADDAADQDHVSVATDGTGYMVAFRDKRFGDEYNFSGTSAVRVTGGGSVLDDPPIEAPTTSGRRGPIRRSPGTGSTGLSPGPRTRARSSTAWSTPTSAASRRRERSWTATPCRSAPDTCISSTRRSPSPATGTWRSWATAVNAPSGRSA